jgi:endonuclease/exonuclease/phosphatase family metal-dependent hydrolase
MAKKKSRIRIVGKKAILFLNLLISALLLYPLFFSPISLIWLNGFLGIITPYLLVIELLLFIFWLIIKPILALPSLISLLIGWKLITVLIAWHPGTSFPQKKKNNTLRIISWNVRGFNGVHPNSGLKLRTQDIAYSIQKWNPDIICMQEYNTNERPEDIANHAQYFTEKYPYSFFSKDYQTPETAYYSGCIIYSKYKIIKSERFPFTNQESLIAATILKGDDTIRIFTTHLASYKFKQNDFESIDDASKNKWGVLSKMKLAFTERAIQAEIVKAQMNASPYPSILTGDFNDVPNSYTYQKIANGWQDAFIEKGVGIGATYLGISPILRIDYILANASWQVKSWEQVDENLSDHHMIMADLLLKKQ